MIRIAIPSLCYVVILILFHIITSMIAVITGSSINKVFIRGIIEEEDEMGIEGRRREGGEIAFAALFIFLLIAFMSHGNLHELITKATGLGAGWAVVRHVFINAHSTSTSSSTGFLIGLCMEVIDLEVGGEGVCFG